MQRNDQELHSQLEAMHHALHCKAWAVSLRLCLHGRIVTWWVQAVTRALPLETCASWTVAPDSVQAVSCMVTALNLFNIHGKDFLYESSVEGILHVLKHLGQSPAYLGIITGRS
jgi:hypothetical protein